MEDTIDPASSRSGTAGKQYSATIRWKWSENNKSVGPMDKSQIQWKWLYPRSFTTINQNIYTVRISACPIIATRHDDGIVTEPRDDASHRLMLMTGRRAAHMRYYRILVVATATNELQTPIGWNFSAWRNGLIVKRAKPLSRRSTRNIILAWRLLCDYIDPM